MIWLIDRTLSGATTSSQSETGSDGNEGVLHIPQNSSFDDLMLYSGHSLASLPFCRDAVSIFYSPNWTGSRWGQSYPTEEMRSVYSTVPIEWALIKGSLTPLKRCSRYILQPQPNGLSLREVLPHVEMQSVHCTASTHWTNFVCDLKAAQMNEQCCLIQKKKQKKKLSHNTVEATPKHSLCKRKRCSRSWYSLQVHEILLRMQELRLSRKIR